VVIGAGGVERVLEIKLDATEKQMFEKSVASVRSLIAAASALNPAFPKGIDADQAKPLAPRIYRNQSAKRSPKGLRDDMNIHEYQAKAILREFGAPSP